ncbi:TetR/AcrR family transcriptional regulator C-terminal ligand-binding domain-containing protein [Nocardia terpenica]|uniref:TetR/AcrR family transcriptional regulator n=1 Tax=Nocardia terpenica TaxID=455432 RepID=UPI0018930564|nr:TetR/AcrR family transcriptional regulator [Nocardia terpenica]MBF6059223.1 TetR/AcrR family transcriptional regulator C-terminal ligand-binding domain-containing protein [Nocardia terpenica]MBF6103238.1 TetR/AcrR family transcriptional regulator C-terminal ligand-binding domain-containing protein [Nocardia terpenica]MBF6110573.1 TetR/AcrR family transcriptional regulator C-terminal ligand-binding domain-containing protein [Nocardia terpenica]MBF6116704.1 TetR/AcrR family transcriptional reg
METVRRAAGRKRDPRTDIAAREAVLDLVCAGATLSGLSLVTIAEHAGVSRNSLYRRWKRKDDLYLDVLEAINQPLPDLADDTAREQMIAQLALLIERTLDRRASAMIRALLAEADAFPDLYRRYFDEIVDPRRQAMYRIIERGTTTGEIRPDVDPALINEVLAAPLLARMGTHSTTGLDPADTARRLVDLVFTGIQPR